MNAWSSCGEGKFKEFCTMLPEYADYRYGEGNMHDTVMPFSACLGWDKYDGKVEFITDLFASSGTGLPKPTLCPAPPRRKEPPLRRILSLSVPTTSAKRLIYPARSPSQSGAGCHRHLPLVVSAAAPSGWTPGRWPTASRITPSHMTLKIGSGVARRAVKRVGEMLFG